MDPDDDVPGQVVIGLDVGTTGAKAAAFAPGSSWRRLAVHEHPLLNPAPGWFVQEPGTIVASAATALAECVAAVAGAEVLAVSVGSGMHGLMALDDGSQPLTPMLTWADARAGAEAAALHRSGEAVGLHARSGVPVHAMNPVAKLLWFAAHEPDVWRRARWWIGIKDHLLSWLTGRLVTEVSSASASGLLDLTTATWSTPTLELCGVRHDQLPPVLATTATVPMTASTARQVGLPVGTPVVVGAGDGPLANVGTGALTPGVAGLSLGTSGAVRVTVGAPVDRLGGSLFCYALTDEAWVVGGAISNGGSVLRWAGQALAPDVVLVAGDERQDDAVLDLAAGVPPGSDGLVMLPHLLPERVPQWDLDRGGAYLGLRPEHTRAHLLRASVEGVALQMRALVDGLAAVEPVDRVRATGGVFRSALWRDVMAATIGRPLHLADDADGSALGAAALGLVALDRATGLVDAAHQLGVDADTPPPAVEADPAAVAAYDRLRASVPEMVVQLPPR